MRGLRPKFPAQLFRVYLKETRIRPDSGGGRAARLVLVEGVADSDAAVAVGISRQAVGRAVHRIISAAKEGQTHCPMCGNAIFKEWTPKTARKAKGGA